MEINTTLFNETAGKEIRNPYARAFLKALTATIAARRKTVMDDFPDPGAAQACGQAIRAGVVARLPELLEEFEKNALERGAKILWARDAREANEMVLSIARERNVAYVTKGKSMVTEEMGLNDALAEGGIEPFETDLGEFIAQQLRRPPFHIVGPAINVPVEQVCDLFMEKARMEKPTTDPVELGYAARLFLRDKFHHAALGVTGVNMAVAETGTIINVENEGNIRFNKSSPKTQVSIMSIEKVVPTMSDAMHLLRLLCRNCTGQKISAYVSLDSGPRKAGEIDGPEELIIIIIDNGRSELYGDTQAREALRCIRCGACLNTCPVYTKIGGYPYGWVYSGPMGQVLNPLLLGLDRTQDLYRACTLCGTCRDICPGGVDHPSLFLYYRAKDVEGDPRFKGRKPHWKETRFFDLWTWAVIHAWFWNLAVRCARPFVNRSARDGVIRGMGRFFEGWFKERDLPAMADKTFHERWKGLKKERQRP
jgi:L-lactate dehydrogenase complex protein LldF